jgi:hypothetical protein
MQQLTASISQRSGEKKFRFEWAKLKAGKPGRVISKPLLSTVPVVVST